MKKNKGLIIGLIVVVVAIIAIVCATVFVKPSYKKQIKKFAEACESEEKMEKYVKKYVNLRAYYAMQNSEEPKNMDEEYKKAKKKDYTDDEFVEDVVDVFKDYTSLGKDVKIENIEKEEKIDENSGFLSVFSEVKGATKVKFKLKLGDVEQDCYAIFYKGKMLMIMADMQAQYDALENAQDALENMEN